MFGSVPDWMQARLSLAVQGIESFEIFFQVVGFGVRNKWFLVSAFSFLYYLPDKFRRSLWILLGLSLKSYEIIKMLLVV